MARTIGRLSFSDDGQDAWGTFYNSLDDDLGGVVGALVARAEAQLLRLAVTYALLDGSALIERRHVEAAEAVWDSCVETVHRVFADELPDYVLPTLLAALRTAGPEGLDGTQQQNLFSRHQTGHRLAAARAQLQARGIAFTVAEETGGRPRIITRLVDAGDDRQQDLSSLSSPSCSHDDCEAS
jgi:hypothetical protein